MHRIVKVQPCPCPHTAALASGRALPRMPASQNSCVVTGHGQARRIVSQHTMLTRPRRDILVANKVGAGIGHPRHQPGTARSSGHFHAQPFELAGKLVPAGFTLGFAGKDRAPAQDRRHDGRQARLHAGSHLCVQVARRARQGHVQHPVERARNVPTASNAWHCAAAG